LRSKKTGAKKKNPTLGKKRLGKGGGVFGHHPIKARFRGWGGWVGGKCPPQPEPGKGQKKDKRKVGSPLSRQEYVDITPNKNHKRGKKKGPEKRNGGALGPFLAVF